MSELNFMGKEFVYNDHLSVPFRPLVMDAEKGIGEPSLDGNLILHGDNLHRKQDIGLDDLVGRIELLQERIRAYETTLRGDELRTRMAPIDPLLHALGWRIADPGMVTPEYKVGDKNESADYALLRLDGKPVAIIEAKRLGTALVPHRMQMLNYANAAGIEFAGLTDGDNWALHRVFQRGPLEERRMLEVSIANDPVPASALKLLVLWRPNLSSGEPVPAGEPIGNVLNSPQPEPDEPDSPPRPSGPNWFTLSESNPPPRTPPPMAIRFRDREQREVGAWIQVLTRVVEKLYRDKRLTVQDLPIGWSSQAYCVHTEPVHPNGKKFVASERIEGTPPLFVNTYLNAGQARSNTKNLLKRYDQSPADVHLQVAQ